MKKILTFILAAMLLLTFAVPVLAAAEYVVDDADILTDSEERDLEALAQSVSARYGCDVYILTMYDYSDYGSGDVRNVAEQYYSANSLGQGSDRNGVLLFLSMAERDYALIAYGDLAHTAFTDYGKEMLSEEFLDDFRYDDWYSGFEDYLDGCQWLLDSEASGEPVDVPADSGSNVWLVLLIPLAVAGVVCGIMAASMKSARVQSGAGSYITDGGVQITARSDRFINRTVVRQPIENNSSSNGGTRINSGGFSGRSGKF